MGAEKQEFLELYKIHAEFADRVSQRREGANRLFVSLLSGTLIFLAAFFRYGTNAVFSSNEVLMLTVAIGVLGISLTIAWYITIRSYRQLNDGKFDALLELEKELAYPFYTREWKFLKQGRNRNKYWKLTVVETFLPIIFFLFFLVITCLSVYPFLPSVFSFLCAVFYNKF